MLILLLTTEELLEEELDDELLLAALCFVWLVGVVCERVEAAVVAGVCLVFVVAGWVLVEIWAVAGVAGSAFGFCIVGRAGAGA